MKRNVIVEAFGEAFSVKHETWISFLSAVVEGKEPNIADYGRSLGLIHNVTDINREEALELLRK